jgi:hypothetical protein
MKVKSVKSSLSLFGALRLIIALTLAFAFGAAFAQDETSALRMVKSLGLGNNLGTMSYNFSKITQTHLGVASKVGPEKADQMLRAELAVTVPKYQDQWDKNLAQSWAPLMTNEEFASVASQKQQSPHFPKFMSLQNQAGATMKAKSQTLLTTVMAEALNGELAKSVSGK